MSLKDVLNFFKKYNISPPSDSNKENDSNVKVFPFFDFPPEMQQLIISFLSSKTILCLIQLVSKYFQTLALSPVVHAHTISFDLKSIYHLKSIPMFIFRFATVLKIGYSADVMENKFKGFQVFKKFISGVSKENLGSLEEIHLHMGLFIVGFKHELLIKELNGFKNLKRISLHNHRSSEFYTFLNILQHFKKFKMLNKVDLHSYVMTDIMQSASKGSQRMKNCLDYYFKKYLMDKTIHTDINGDFSSEMPLLKCINLGGSHIKNQFSSELLLQFFEKNKQLEETKIVLCSSEEVVKKFICLKYLPELKRLNLINLISVKKVPALEEFEKEEVKQEDFNKIEYLNIMNSTNLIDGYLELFGRLKVLKIMNSHLREFPKNLDLFKNTLEVFIFTQNVDFFIPPSFIRNKKYPKCHLKIPENISSLTHLKTCKIILNQKVMLCFLPKSFDNLKGLRKLHLQKLYIEVLNKCLEKINLVKLVDCRIKMFDTEKGVCLRKIKVLDCTNDSAFKLINLKSIEKLKFTKTKLKKFGLSNEKESMSKLTRVNLSRCGLKDFPIEIVEGCLLLKKLNLNGNELKEVPNKVFNLQFLETLMIECNKIIKIDWKLMEENARNLSVVNINCNPVYDEITQIYGKDTKSLTNLINFFKENEKINGSIEKGEKFFHFDRIIKLHNHVIFKVFRIREHKHFLQHILRVDMYSISVNKNGYIINIQKKTVLDLYFKILHSKKRKQCYGEKKLYERLTKDLIWCNLKEGKIIGKYDYKGYNLQKLEVKKEIKSDEFLESFIINEYIDTN